MREFSDIALAEYQKLNDEIARHESQIFEMFKFALTGAVAIIAFGLQQAAAQNMNAWGIVATVPLLVLPAGIFTLSRALMQMRIGAYIQAYFEEASPEVSWEQVLAARSADSGWPDFWLKLAIFSGYVTVALAGLLIAWMLAPLAEPVVRIVMWTETVAVVLLAIVVIVPFARGRRERLEYGDLPAFRDLSEYSMTERDGRFYCERVE